MKISPLTCRWVLAVGLVLLLTFDSQAENKPPDCEKEPACMALWTRAGEFSKEGKLADAQRMYQLAYEVRADPRLLFNIGRVLHKQGLTAEAAPYYQRYLDANLDDIEQKQKARDYLEQSRKGEPAKQESEAPLRFAPSGEAAPTGNLVEGQPAKTQAADSGAAARPVYKKWWFWTIVGVAAGGVAAGVAVGATRSRTSLEFPADATVLTPTF